MSHYVSFNCPSHGDQDVDADYVACPECEAATVAAKDARIATLERKLAVAAAALREIERHHVALNARAGREADMSYTIRTARSFLHRAHERGPK